MACAEDFEALEEAVDDHEGEIVAVCSGKQTARRTPYYHDPDCYRVGDDPQTLRRRDARSHGFRPAPCCLQEDDDD